MFKQSSVCNKNIHTKKSSVNIQKEFTIYEQIQPVVKKVHRIFQKVHRTLKTSSPILNKCSMHI